MLKLCNISYKKRCYLKFAIKKQLNIIVAFYLAFFAIFLIWSLNYLSFVTLPSSLTGMAFPKIDADKFY